MANIWEIATLILAGNLNLGLSYFATPVPIIWLSILHFLETDLDKIWSKELEPRKDQAQGT